MSLLYQQGAGKHLHCWSFRAARRLLYHRGPLLAGFFLLTAIFVISGWPQAARIASATTEDHIAEKGSWPTKRPLPSDSFAGDAACAKCHAPFAAMQATSAMTHAAFHTSGTPDSGKPAQGTFQSGPYLYAYVHQDPGYAMEVKAGDTTLRSKVDWTFGAGNHGQTYLLKENDGLYESQVSSFATGYLGLTPGHAEASDNSEVSLQHALGNRLSSLEAARCFSCHTTAWSRGGKLDLEGATPGVHCEACHGPGAAHVAALRSGQTTAAANAILNPARLSPAASVDFCGACHRTSMDIMLAGSPAGVSSLRFQPYRLQKSSCWNRTQDQRLTCVGCHNPHEALVHDTSFYDRKCLACHSQPAPSPRNTAVASQAPDPRICPKAKTNCTSCHMPRYTVPEMHSKFTDHFIRIMKVDAPFPQ